MYQTSQSNSQPSVNVLFKPPGVELNVELLRDFYMSCRGVDLCQLTKAGKLEKVHYYSVKSNKEKGQLFLMTDEALSYPIIKLVGDKYAIILTCNLLTEEPARFLALGNYLDKEDSVKWKNTFLKKSTCVYRSGDDFEVSCLKNEYAGHFTNSTLDYEKKENIVDFPLEVVEEEISQNDQGMSVSFRKMPRVLLDLPGSECISEAQTITVVKRHPRLYNGDVVVSVTYPGQTPLSTTTKFNPSKGFLNEVLAKKQPFNLEVRRFQRDVNTWIMIRAQVNPNQVEKSDSKDDEVSLIPLASKKYFSHPDYAQKELLPYINNSKIYLAKHSEGGMISSLGAQQGDYIYSIYCKGHGIIIGPNIENFKKNTILGAEILRPSGSVLLYMVLGEVEETTLSISERASIIKKIINCLSFPSEDERNFHQDQLNLLTDEDLLAQPGAK